VNETTELVLITERLDGDNIREQAAGMFAALAAKLLRSRGNPWDFATIELLSVALHATASGFAGEISDDEGADEHAAVALFGTLLTACAYEATAPEKAARLRREALPLFKSATERATP